MEEIKSAIEALEASKSHATLVGKILGLWPWSANRRLGVQSAAVTEANDQSLATVQAALTDQVVALVEQYPNDPLVLDAIINAGGKFNLENLARILRMAALQLNNDARPELISDDWAANARDKAKTCSDPDMAELWAQLIADEANAPGSYSRKTVNVLADLEPDDARLFRNLSMFRVHPVDVVYSKSSGGVVEAKIHRVPHLMVTDDDDPLYARAGINFVLLSRLEWLGLITNYVTGIQLGSSDEGGPEFWIRSFGNGQFLYIARGKDLGMGHYKFTPAGEQIAELCVPLEPPDGFVDHVAKFWRAQGLHVTGDITEAIAWGQQAKP